MSNFTDWNDVAAAAQHLVGNWRNFPCFAWSRGNDLDDADRWTLWYTSGRDSTLLAQSNHEEIAKRVAPFTSGDDPDVVAERHSHWAVGYLDGFSMRVFGKDGGITPAFEEFCRLQQALEEYPVLDEQDYADREYDATLDNYRSEMWPRRDSLPQGWEGQVYSWFADHDHDSCIENRDDQGGWAPRENIAEALHAMGLLPAAVVEREVST